MELQDMERFFEVVVKKYLQDIEEKFLDYKDCIKIRNSDKDIKRTYKFYESERKKVYCYMASDVKALDRHKVASCFMYALLKYRLVKVNKLKRKLPKELLMVNEYLACTVAMNIVAMYHREIKQDTSFILYIPRTNHDLNQNDSAFVANLCKALYYLRSSSCFDPFAYSAILFLLEKYTEAVSKH